MPEFLSPEWAAAVNDALAGLALDPDVAVVVGHLVRRGDGTDIGYVVRVSGGVASAEIGDATIVDGADVVLLHDEATAAAIHDGELSAQQAVEAGRLKLRGNAHALVTNAATFAQLRETIASAK